VHAADLGVRLQALGNLQRTPAAAMTHTDA
jgi:hypothetical protein